MTLQPIYVAFKRIHGGAVRNLQNACGEKKDCISVKEMHEKVCTRLLSLLHLITDFTCGLCSTPNNYFTTHGFIKERKDVRMD